MKHRKLPIRRVFSGRLDWPCPTDAQAHNRCAFALMQVLVSLLNPGSLSASTQESRTRRPRRMGCPRFEMLIKRSFVCCCWYSSTSYTNGDRICRCFSANRVDADGFPPRHVCRLSPRGAQAWVSSRPQLMARRAMSLGRPLRWPFKLNGGRRDSLARQLLGISEGLLLIKYRHEAQLDCISQASCQRIHRTRRVRTCLRLPRSCEEASGHDDCSRADVGVMPGRHPH